MNDLGTRYSQLCQAYTQLSDRFQKLDVEHMTLRRNVVSLLKAIKVYTQVVEQLKQDKLALEEQLKIKDETFTQDRKSLEEQLQAMTAMAEQLQALKILLEPELQASLEEAEEQIKLVDSTIEEMEGDRDPDLNPEEKTLLEEYCKNPSTFVMTDEIAAIIHQVGSHFDASKILVHF